MTSWARIGAIAGVMLMLAAAEARAACTISTTSVSLGTYNVFSASPLDSTGTVVFRCGPLDRNITVMLSAGQSGTFSPRRMAKGAEWLLYNLYRDAARTSIWGDGTGGSSYYLNADPPNNSNVTLTIYARVPAGQDVSAGSYTDTVTALINF